MPVFNAYNLLFIHIPKTAGGSVEDLLSNLSHQKLKSKPMFFDRLARVHELGQNKSRILFGIDSRRIVLQHLTPMEMIGLGYISAQKYKNMNRFTIIRNPVQRAISQYFSHNRYKKFRCFEDFVDRFIYGELSSHNDVSHRRPQSDFLWLGNKQDPQIKLIKFENLEVELRCYLSHLGITYQQLSKKNAASKKTSGFTISRECRLKLEAYYLTDLELWHSLS